MFKKIKVIPLLITILPKQTFRGVEQSRSERSLFLLKYDNQEGNFNRLK